MALSIGNKTFMNLQEAVGWLLENNALPFQSTANYAGNTEIAMSTLINPSPAKVRVGSLIFFADSKVSTVVGVTSNSFICSDQYNDLVDDVVYVSNVALNGSGHLIVTLSNGDNIDAGLIKQVTGFSINGSQHLIASYNDSTSTDLGAIFSGNVNISGTLNATSITGNSIIETMSGFSFTKSTGTNYDHNYLYAGAVKNGNKLTFVVCVKVTKRSGAGSNVGIGKFTIPNSIGTKLYPYTLGGNDWLDNKLIPAFSSSSVPDFTVAVRTGKYSNTEIGLSIASTSDFVTDTEYCLRYEVTFLLSENLAV